MALSKNNKYAINWLYTNGTSVEDIASELKLSIDDIKKYIEKNNLLNESNLATKSQPVKSSKDLMIRHTRDKRSNNVSIMTQEASQMNDSMRNSLRSKESQNNCIFKPKN